MTAVAPFKTLPRSIARDCHGFVSWSMMISSVRINFPRAVPRTRPPFGHLPGEQNARRWPDILRSDVVGDAGAAAFLERFRDGQSVMDPHYAHALALRLKLPPDVTHDVMRFLVETNLTNVDAEWALTNLIDAAVEVYGP